MVCFHIICFLEIQYFKADSVGDRYLDWCLGLVNDCFSRFAIDDTAVPEVVGVIIIRNLILWF